MLLCARGEACSADTREQALPHITAPLNQSAFLSPQSSSQGSQVQRAMSDSFFPICQREVKFENTEITSHLAQTEAHPWGSPGPGSRQGWCEQHPGRPGTPCGPGSGAPPSLPEIPPPSTPGAVFSTLGFNFLLCLDTGRRAGMGVSVSLMGVRSLRSPRPREETGKVNFTKGTCIFQERSFQTNCPTSLICMES